MDGYQLTADLSIKYGGLVAVLIVCFGLVFVLFGGWFWFACLSHAYKSDFRDRELWIAMLLVSFFLPGFIWAMIASAIYYLLFRPNFGLLKKDSESSHPNSKEHKDK